MIFWGSVERHHYEDSGTFHCPSCEAESDFSLMRTWSYFHVYFIPLAKQRLISEQIQCHACSTIYPLTVLANSLTEGPLPGEFQAKSVSDNFGNVVSLTPSAVEEIQRRHTEAEFDPDVVVRVEPDPLSPRSVKVTFDFALADGRDWIGESNGIPVVVSREDAMGTPGSRDRLPA